MLASASDADSEGAASGLIVAQATGMAALIDSMISATKS